MNSKKLKWAGLFTIVFCLNLFCTIDANAQTQKQKARDKARLEAEQAANAEEVKVMSPEEKKAAIKKDKEKRSKARKAAAKSLNDRRVGRNAGMYEKLKMTEEQIEKYEKMNDEYSKATKKAIEENSGDKESLQKAMQKISKDKTTKLATIFKGDQLKQYEIYQEEDATNRTKKKYRHMVKDLDAKK